MSQLVLTKGQSGSFTVTVKRNGAVVDITAVQLRFEARRNPADAAAVITKTVGSGIVIVDGPAGVASINIDVADSDQFDESEILLFWKLDLNAGLDWERVDTGTLFFGPQDADDTYISLADVRAEGVTSGMADDATVLAAIKTWQAFLERACRQWFYPKDLTVLLDGTDSDALHFNVPIVSCAEIRINGQDVALDKTYYRVYSGGEDRKNPRIKLIDNHAYHHDIYTAPMGMGRLLFRKGRQNQYVRAMFGYIEADGSPPALIQRALMKLVIEKLATPLVPNFSGPMVPPPLLAGVISEEWTDGHKIKYEPKGGALKPRAPGLAGITNDQEILNIIKLYKAPLGVIAVAAGTSYR